MNIPGSRLMLSVICLLLGSILSGQSPAAQNNSIPRIVQLKPDLKIELESLDKRVRFSGIMHAEMDPQGQLYILDNKEGRISVFSSRHRFVRHIGRSGQGPGELSYFALTFCLGPENTLYLQDRNKVELFQTDGRSLRQIKIPPSEILQAMYPVENGLFLTTQARYRRSSKESILVKKVILSDTEFNPIKCLYTAESNRAFYDFCAIRDGSFYILHPSTEAYTIERFDRQGRPLPPLSRPYKPIKKSPRDIAEEKKTKGSLISAVTGGDAKSYQPEPYQFAVDFIMTDGQGRLLTWTHSESPEDRNVHFDRFSRDGRTWQRFRLDSYETPRFFAHQGSLWVLDGPTEEGTFLIRYPLPRS